MSWLLVEFCLLGFISVSAASVQITQTPRFYGLKRGHNVIISCAPNPPVPTTVQWYKAATYSEEKVVLEGDRVGYRDRNLTQKAYLLMRNVQVQDTGVYFCEMNNTMGPGTQLVVLKATDLVKALYRSRVKDGLIILQGLLMAMCIAAMFLRGQTLSEKEDDIYEEPQSEHIYQGLGIDSVGDALYEELTVYAQAEATEAPWE